MESGSGVSFHLQDQLEAVKTECAEALSRFSEAMLQNCLFDVVKSSSLNVDETIVRKNDPTFSVFQWQVEYISSILRISKIFPKDIGLEMGWKVLRECDPLLKGALHEMVKVQTGKECDSTTEKGLVSNSQQVASLLILPTMQLIQDCIEIFTVVNESRNSLVEAVMQSMKIFGESTKFLVGSSGLSLGRPEYLRIMGVCQKLWKFAEHVRKTCAQTEFKDEINKMTETALDEMNETLYQCGCPLFSTANGRSFLKFWYGILKKEKDLGICNALKQLSSTANHISEIYMVFASYLEDEKFWKTDAGKSLTPLLIRGVMNDMDCDNVETKKRAAFVLRLLTDQYSQRKSIFDSTIPEVNWISLGNMELVDYTKFWDSFFDLYDILNETQLHIVQPVLHKLQIFGSPSTHSVAFVWLPILLKKMIKHDNRTIVKEGFEQFLQTKQYLVIQDDNTVLTYRHLAQEFLQKYVMPLIRDHIGWVLYEPEEYLKNITEFSSFLIQLHSNHELSEFRSAEMILEFLTSSGKCMGPHTIFFLVASVDELLCSNNKETLRSTWKSLPNVEGLINKLALLMSNNLTTVSKYFRELLEYRCVKILLNLMPFFKTDPIIQLDSYIFMKLLAFLGSLSTKVLFDKNTLLQMQVVTRTLYEKVPTLFNELLIGNKMYEFAKSNLSMTSVIGLLRMIVIFSQIATSEMLVNIQRAVGNFAKWNATEELFSGSVQGLRDFYQNYNIAVIDDALTNPYVAMFKEICEMVIKTDDDHLISSHDFMFCVRRMEVLNAVPDTFLQKAHLPEYKHYSCPLKVFLFQKLYLLKSVKGLSLTSMRSFNTYSNSSNDEDNVGDMYFDMTERNLFAECRQVQFYFSASVIDNNSDAVVHKDVLNSLLVNVLDEIEKCDFRGVAAGLFLAKLVTQLVDYKDEWDGFDTLNSIVSVGWSLVFELRKSEAFWLGLRAFVELIICPCFVKNGFLNKYADLLFEHGESVSGLPLVLIQQLVRVDYPAELLGDINTILVKAAVSGGPVPKNNRVSFAIWDYLRHGRNGVHDEDDNDPENFSSDCKARILACENLRSNVADLLTAEGNEELALTFLRCTVLSVLERNDIESNKRRYFQGSSTHRVKQRIMQILLTLQPYFNLEISKTVLDKILCSLSTDSPQPSVRYMGEWLVIRILQQYPELNSHFFDCLDNCIQKRLGFGAFFSTICLHVSKNVQCSAFYDRALQSLATLTLSQHLTVRIYSQVAFQRIFERTITLNLIDVKEKYAPVLSALLNAATYVSGNCCKLLENVSQDFYVNVFDSVDHYRPEVIFTLLPRLSGMIKDECILKPATIRNMISMSNESSMQNLEHIYLHHEKTAWHLKTVVADGRELGEELPNDMNPSTVMTSEQAQNKEINYQKKINPWKLLSASDEIEDYSNTAMKKRCVGEEGLVVVASLLDHLPNLGGLCRTCEIFGVQKYVMNSLKVVNDQHFQSLSVSAHNWVNILEVPIRDLESFLLTYSSKGYTILGVEQANESSSLTDFTFPKKSVLLLGNEKLGLPSELLRLVDKCIEIPQIGIIRSLNVHVTGALCIWQYASQHSF